MKTLVAGSSLNHETNRSALPTPNQTQNPEPAKPPHFKPIGEHLVETKPQPFPAHSNDPG